MPLDYQSRQATELERSNSRLIALCTAVAICISIAAAVKAFMVLDGIIDDEKPALVGLLVVGCALDVAALAVNILARKDGGIIASLFSLLLVATAVLLTIRAW